VHDQEDGRRDFDFILGRWRVDNRRLVDPVDPACDEWLEFEAAGDARLLLDGLGNIDTFSVPAIPPHGAPYHGLALRLFDPETRLWRIWWASTRDPGHLDSPLTGRFDHRGRGEFHGDEVIAGRATKIRFLWQAAQPTRWQQAFSFDDGTTWQTNWVMTFTRTGAA
jgi:hypothetical protein